MTKYLNKEAFSSPANSKSYRDNYDATFGKKEVVFNPKDAYAVFMGEKIEPMVLEDGAETFAAGEGICGKMMTPMEAALKAEVVCLALEIDRLKGVLAEGIKISVARMREITHLKGSTDGCCNACGYKQGSEL